VNTHILCISRCEYGFFIEGGCKVDRERVSSSVSSQVVRQNKFLIWILTCLWSRAMLNRVRGLY